MTNSLLNNGTGVSVAAVIVIYNDYHALFELALSLSSQVDLIVIIDNSDDGEVPETVLELSMVVYSRQATNEGLGVGLNVGIVCAIERGAEWVLLLDQDSTVPDNMVDSMLRSYDKYSEYSDFSVLCPSVFLHEKDRFQYPLSFSSFPPTEVKVTSEAVDFCITSGSMIKVSIFEEIGFMDELFFIDYIDYDFCLRVRQAGYKILYVNEAMLNHQLGERQISSIGLSYTFHSPLRLYYQTRNRLIVIKRYGHMYPAFAFMQIILLILKLFKILVVEDKKIDRLRNYFLGFFHSFSKKHSS